MEIQIRKAVPLDCRALSVLKRAVWETTYRGIYPDEMLDQYDSHKHEEKFRAILANPDISLYTARDAEQLIGYMSCGAPFRPFQDYQFEISLLYVKKEYQGHGIGKRLLQTGISELRGRGATEFFISCNKYNTPAQQFYRKMGGILVHVDPDCEDHSIPQVKFHFSIETVKPNGT